MQNLKNIIDLIWIKDKQIQTEPHLKLICNRKELRLQINYYSFGSNIYHKNYLLKSFALLWVLFFFIVCIVSVSQQRWICSVPSIYSWKKNPIPESNFTCNGIRSWQILRCEQKYRSVRGAWCFHSSSHLSVTEVTRNTYRFDFGFLKSCNCPFCWKLERFCARRLPACLHDLNARFWRFIK